MKPQDDSVNQIGAWRVNPALDEISRDGQTIKLEPKMMQLLLCLAAHAGEVVSVEQLLDQVWKDVVVTPDSVYHAVSALRRVLGDDSKDPSYIANVMRRGYRLIAPVVRLGQAEAPAPPLESPHSAAGTQAMKPTGEVPLRHSNHKLTGRRLAIATATVLAMALAYFVSDRFWISKRSRGTQAAAPIAQTDSAPPTAAVAFTRPPYSIVVLPLVNESGEASQQYFSDGISEDLITALSQFPGLKVIGRTSAFQFRDSKEDSRSIGAKLGVAHLLEGSVRRSGEMVRVSAELIDTADGSTQWAERYDRPYKDLFALQDEITHAVAGALRAKLLPGEHAAEQSERPPGGSLEAYNALLQGRFYFSRGTEADYRKAIESYTQATLLDPRYALAWSELSGAWGSLGENFLGGAPAQQAYARAREAADRALTLSPELAAAHIARGALLGDDFDWHGAEAEVRRALALAPNNGDAKFALGTQLAALGEVETAIDLTRQGLVTDPLCADCHYWLAAYLSGLNRLDDAERAIRRAIELQPAAAAYHQMLAVIEVQRGNAPAALRAAQQEPQGNGGWRDSALALALQIGADRGAADRALRTLIDKYANIAPYKIAQIYALRNDPKETFAWLDRAWGNRVPEIAYLLYDPLMTRYKGDPRFAAFCRKVGLPVPGETSSRKSTQLGGSVSVR